MLKLLGFIPVFDYVDAVSLLVSRGCCVPSQLTWNVFNHAVLTSQEIIKCLTAFAQKTVQIFLGNRQTMPLFGTFQIYFVAYSVFLVSHVIFCAYMWLSGQVFCSWEHRKIFNLGNKMLYQCISIEYVPNDCVPAVFGECWRVTLVGNIIHVLTRLCFSSATSCPRMQNPCFKLLVFIIDFTLWQEGSASLEVDTYCLFFAVKVSEV